jgi:hypothetical protein
MSRAAPANAGDPRGRTARRRWLRGIFAVVVTVLLLAAIFAIWYVFLRPAGPPPVGPGAPVIPSDAVSSATATATLVSTTLAVTWALSVPLVLTASM